MISIPSANFTEYFAIEEPRQIVVPAQLGAIADWINTKFSGFLATGSWGSPSAPSMPVDNSTMPDNSTSNATGMFAAENYTLPENCTLSGDDELVSCTDGSNAAIYTFSELNDFYNNRLGGIASRLSNIDSACSNVDTCL